MLKQNVISEEQTRCTDHRKVFSCILTVNQSCTPTIEYSECFNLKTRSAGIYHCVSVGLLPNASTCILDPSSGLNGPLKNFIVASTCFVLTGIDQGDKYEASVNTESSEDDHLDTHTE